MNNKGKCKHGFYTDPNGYHIVPEPEKEKSTAELIDEAKKLLGTNDVKKEPEAPKQEPVNEIKKLSTLLEDAIADY